jgi:DNA-binding Xre family transcriptional regulator
MTLSGSQEHTHRLQQWMQQVGISSFNQLAKTAGVSRWQVQQLRQGNIRQMRVENVEKLAKALQVPVGEILSAFGIGEPASSSVAVEQEYRRLQAQLEQQRDSLWQEFQQACLQTLETWMIQWPTAAYAAQQKPDLPAVRLLPLVKPVENLLQTWGLEAIETVGSEVPFDPHRHQLMEGTANAGDLVKIRYIGYQQGDKLLYRAKVSLIR